MKARSSTDLPEMITTETVGKILQAIYLDPYFQPGSRSHRPSWLDEIVTLEFPLGEIVGPLRLTAMCGASTYEQLPWGERAEGFACNGIEPVCRVKRPLLDALRAVDSCEPYRARVIVKGGRKFKPDVACEIHDEHDEARS